VFHFEQTHLNNVRKFFHQNVREGAMAVPKNDTYKDHACYAEHCLNMMAGCRKVEASQSQMRGEYTWLGMWNFRTISKNKPNGGARRRNAIQMTSATSKPLRSLIGWPQRSILFRKIFSELSLNQA
jgi:hypothetical protein